MRGYDSFQNDNTNTNNFDGLRMIQMTSGDYIGPIVFAFCYLSFTRLATCWVHGK